MKLKVRMLKNETVANRIEDFLKGSPINKATLEPATAVRLLRAALTVIKNECVPFVKPEESSKPEEEPRLLTFEELFTLPVVQYGQDVWFEEWLDDPESRRLIPSSIECTPNEFFGAFFDMTNYNTKIPMGFRLWIGGRPTREKQLAEPWEDPESDEKGE